MNLKNKIKLAEDLKNKVFGSWKDEFELLDKKEKFSFEVKIRPDFIRVSIFIYKNDDDVLIYNFANYFDLEKPFIELSFFDEDENFHRLRDINFNQSFKQLVGGTW